MQNSYHELFQTGCYWIWPLFKHMCHEDAILFYYVNQNGEVHFGIDGVEIDSFYKRVSSLGPLWAILEIDGVSTSIEIIASECTGAENEDPEMNTLQDCLEDRGESFINDEMLCTMCCQKEINSVLYKCGHMCMCFQCAMQQKQGAGNGQCPICRAVIKDVIRTFR